MKIPAVQSTETAEMPADTQVRQADEALLLRFTASGNREAIGELFHRYADNAYAVALRCSGNPSDAEDAVQDAFINVLRHAGQYRSQCSVKGWLMSIVINSCRIKARTASRTRNRERIALIPEPAPAANDTERELLAAASQAVRELPDPYRMPLWLHFLEGLSYQEIAFALNQPEGTIRSHISRGLDRVRKAMELSGHAVGVIALPGLILRSGAETAPARLRSALETIAVSKQLAHPAWANVAAWSVGAVLLASVALTGTLYFRAAPPEQANQSGSKVAKTANAPVPQEQAQVSRGTSHFSRTWRFDRPEAAAGHQVLAGSWTFVPQGETGFMQTGPGRVDIRLDLHALRKPVLIEACHRPLIPNRDVGYDFGGYAPMAKDCVIVRLPERGLVKVTNVKTWLRSRVYISAEGIDIWVHDRRVRAFLGETSTEYITLEFSGTQAIESITAREIDASEATSLALFEDALRQVPKQARRETMAAPGLKDAYFQFEAAAPAR